jgi:PKD repeat protein
MAYLVRTMQPRPTPPRPPNDRRVQRATWGFAAGLSLLVVVLLLGATVLADAAGSAATNAHGPSALTEGAGSPAPILSFAAVPNPTEVGVASVLSVTILGNVTVGDVFSYSGLPAGCASESVGNLTCTPTESGTFEVTVSVVSVLGTVGKSLNWTVDAALAATITAGANAAPLSVHFAGAVEGGAALEQVRWTFGDGTSATGSLLANHTFTSAGTYTVTLEVVDALSVAATSVDNLTLSLPTGTLFAVAVDTEAAGPLPLDVTFQGSASGGSGPYSFAWSFGDGTTGTGAKTSHTYTAQGEFDATLTVTDAASATAEASLIVVVLPPAGTFSASVAANVTTGTSPLSVAFQGSVQGGISPDTYLWDFGDGSATATGSSATHLYTAPGAYEATLTVTDSASAGGAASTTASVVVLVGAPSGALVASASAMVTTGNAPFLASFEGMAYGGVAPYSFSWNLGGGSAAVSGHLVAHVYTTPGTYLATLSLTDADGDVTTAHAQVTVLGAVTGGLGVVARTTVTSGVAPLKVGFSASVSGGSAPYLYLWSFGDGSASLSANPEFVYTTAGSYTASLIVTDSAGASALAYVNIQVETPATGLSVGAVAKVTTVTDLSETVAFTASVHGGAGPYSYAWSFVNASAQSTLATPTFTFTSSGDFEVVLEATDTAGASATYDLNVVVALSGLLVVSSALPSSATASLTWNFQAAAVGGSGPYSYSWNFGDGSSVSAGAAPVHTYSSAGTYLVAVTATDAHGNSTVHDMLVSVSPSSAAPWYESLGPVVALASAVILGVLIGVLGVRRRLASQGTVPDRNGSAAVAASTASPDAGEEARFDAASTEKDVLSDMF